METLIFLLRLLEITVSCALDSTFGLANILQFAKVSTKITEFGIKSTFEGQQAYQSLLQSFSLNLLQ